MRVRFRSNGIPNFLTCHRCWASIPCRPGAQNFCVHDTAPPKRPSFDAAILPCKIFTHSHCLSSCIWLTLATSLHRCKNRDSPVSYGFRNLVLPHTHLMKGGKHLTISYRGPITNRRWRYLSQTVYTSCNLWVNLSLLLCVCLTYSQPAPNEPLGRSVLGRNPSHVTGAESVPITVTHTFVRASSSRRHSMTTSAKWISLPRKVNSYDTTPQDPGETSGWLVVIMIRRRASVGIIYKRQIPNRQSGTIGTNGYRTEKNLVLTSASSELPHLSSGTATQEGQQGRTWRSLRGEREQDDRLIWSAAANPLCVYIPMQVAKVR